MRLAAPGLWPGLEPSATADERHQLLLRAQFAMAPREDEHARCALALADKSQFPEHALDYNIRAERAGWLPSAPQLNTNPLHICRDAAAAGMDPKDYVVKSLQDGSLRFACERPDSPVNFPRNMFIWRSNLLGSSGKGHEYMLKYLLGTKNGVMNEDIGHQHRVQAPQKPNGSTRAPLASSIW